MKPNSRDRREPIDYALKAAFDIANNGPEPECIDALLKKLDRK